MSIFGRLFRVAKAEGNAIVDKFEDPIKMTEQGLRDLRTDLEKSLAALAQAKAVLIKIRKDAEDKKIMASDYEKKAVLLLKKAEGGGMSQQDADRLATEALTKKEQAMDNAVSLSKSLASQEAQTQKLEAVVAKLKSTIGQWENELVTLKSRAKVADASKKLNQQLAQVDSSGTIALLEKMKQKVVEDEALAESYADMANVGNVDEEINKALLGSGPSSSAQDSLAALKAKLKQS